MPAAPQSHITGLRERARFDLGRIAEAEERFFAVYLPEALYTTIPARRQGGGGDEMAPLSLAHYHAAAAEMPLLAGGK